MTSTDEKINYDLEKSFISDMCGIVGVVGFATIPEEKKRSIIRSMGAMQVHRGPDGWGEKVDKTAGLGHNRLAIMDPEHGKQPLVSSEGNECIVFNGEIYNFRTVWRELVSKGYTFKTDHCDTEVILNGYSEWGYNLTEKIKGMYSFAVWDKRKREIFAARDPYGIKPFYYSELTNRGLIFASEPKAIIASELISKTINLNELGNYFLFRAPVHPNTMSKGINKLPAGKRLIYDIDELRLDIADSSLPKNPKVCGKDCPSKKEVKDSLISSVEKRLMADVPLGVFLSGGVDSSIIASIISNKRNVTGFNVGIKGDYDETSYAKKVSDWLNTKLKTRYVDSNKFLDYLDRWVYVNDDPVADPSALALMTLSEFVQEEGMKVMLSGEGADELFCGYNSYKRFLLSKYFLDSSLVSPFKPLLKNIFSGKARDYIDQTQDVRFMGTAHATSSENRKGLIESATGLRGQLDRIGEHVPCDAGDCSALQIASLFDQNVRLQNDLLMRTDRATMSYSIEARVPFLDIQVGRLANALRDNDRVNMFPSFENKPLLKKIAAKMVPSDVVYRKKVGFDIPMHKWTTNGPLWEVGMDLLSDGKIDGLNYNFVYKFFCESNKREHASGIWAWLQLELWYRKWILQSPQPDTMDAANDPVIRGKLMQ